MKITNLLLLTAFCWVWAGADVRATHIVGGDIRYECLGYNSTTQEVHLRIIMHVYRDAINGQAPFDDPAVVAIYAGNSTVFPEETVYMYSPTIVNVPLNTGNPCMIVPPDIKVEEGLYVDEVTLPYNASGYTIAYQRCCRNNTISNVVLPSGSTYSIFLSGAAQTGCNSSPYFNNFPPPIICQNTPLNFDHSATDPNGHTLVYEMCHPSDGASETDPAPNPPDAPPYSNISYRPGFSSGYPMPANPALQINNNTGLLTGTPTMLGQYVVGICVSEYDANGNLLSRVLRDFQFNVAYCENSIHAAVQADSSDAAGNNFYWLRCGGGNTMTFINESTVESLISTYEWRFNVSGGSPILSSAVDPTITFPGPGTYTGWLVPNPGQPGCSDTAFLEITIMPELNTGIQAAINPCDPPSTIIQFNNQTTGGSGIYSHQWNFGNGQTSTAANPAYSYGNNPGNYTVTLQVTDTEGCTAAATMPVTWFPPAVMNISFDYHGCRFDTLQFFNNSLPINGYSHVWDFGDGSPTSTDVAPLHVYATAGTYTVTLTTTSPTGCTATYTQIFQVHELPTAGFVMTYDSCTYEPVQFTSTSTGSGSALVTWSWDFHDGTFSAATNPQHLYTLAGTYPVSLTVTDANDCQASIQDDILWYPRPVIAVNIPATVGCAPHYILFDNQSYPINGYTTAWSFGDGGTSLLPSPTHTYQNPGIYYVNLLITSPLNCQATFRDTIEVFERPNAEFDVDFDLCEIEPVAFDESSTPNSQGVALTAWEWDFDDGTPLLLAQDNTHLYSLAGDFDVRLVVTDANGCTDTTYQLVRWHPAPIVAVDVSSSYGCQPLVVDFINNSYPINGYATTWDFGDGGTATTASPSYVFQDHGVFNVHLHILSPTGCIGDFYDTVTVLEKPNAAFDYDYDSCSLSEVVIHDLSAPNTAGNPITTWVWDFGNSTGGTFTQSIGDTVLAYVPRNDYTVSLFVEDTNGCRDTSVQIVHYFPAPVFPVATHSDTACAPLLVAFTNNPDNDYLGYSSVWNFGNGQTAAVFDTTVIYPDRGTYYAYLVVTSASGCIDTFPDTIKVLGNPVARFNAQYDPCALDGAVTFVNASTPSPDAILTAWQWDFGDGASATGHRNDHTFSDTGTYVVRMQVTDANGCTDDTTRSIAFYPQPVYPINLENSVGCVPLSIDNPDDSPYPLAGYSLHWSYGDGRTSTAARPPDYAYTVPGDYIRKVVVTSPIGCVDSFISTHEALMVPTAAFGYQPTEINSFNPTVQFTDSSLNAAAWLWSFGESNAQSYHQNPAYTYADTGQVQVQLVATHINGCTDTLVKILDIVPRFTYFLPNAFTPNSDGKNDGYRGNGFFEYILQFEMQIYNRWGECVFRTNSPLDEWNGRKNNTGELCQAGVYVVVVRLQGGREQPTEIKGFATIVY